MAKKTKLVIKSFDDLKKLIRLKDGSYMDIDEWCSIPYEGCSKTEDVECEIIEPKKIEYHEKNN